MSPEDDWLEAAYEDRNGCAVEIDDDEGIWC